MKWDAIVVGGGCAGLAAGTQLAESGYRVLLLERRPLLGGRACSFKDKESGEILDNGQHLFLGCYQETRKFLSRIGTGHQLRFEDRFSTPMVGPNRETAYLSTASLPAPWHLAWGLFRYSALSKKERLATLRVARSLEGNLDVLRKFSVSAWLQLLGQSKRSRTRLWDPLTLATLNIHPDEAPANLLAVVLRQGFLASRKASQTGLASVGLTELHGTPSRSYLEKHGGEVRLQTSVKQFLVHEGRVCGVELMNGENEISDVVISAVPPPAARKLSQGVHPELEKFLKPSQELRPSPIVSLHAWLKDPPFTAPLLGFWDRPFHWAFCKSIICQDPSVRHVSMVISAADAVLEESKSELIRLAEEDLKLLAKPNRPKITRAVVVREREATWVPPLSGSKVRPGGQTPEANVFLAGDWTDTGLPATIEGAVLSGHVAARQASTYLQRSKVFRSRVEREREMQL